MILVVDDHAEIRDLTARLLRTVGYTVSTAFDGIDALEKIALHPPGLILLDMSMPRMNGLDVLRLLKTSPVTCSIPVVMLSANVLPTIIDAATTLGAAGFLAKPVDLPTLLRTIEPLARPDPQTSRPGLNSTSHAIKPAPASRDLDPDPTA